ncbi:unnamed protein product, partial [Coregonus sp. 'balchen']
NLTINPNGGEEAEVHHNGEVEEGEDPHNNHKPTCLNTRAQQDPMNTQSGPRRGRQRTGQNSGGAMMEDIHQLDSAQNSVENKINIGPPREGGHMPSLDVQQIEMTDYVMKLTEFSAALSSQVQKAQEGELSGSTLTLKVKVGDWVRVKVHKRKWLEPRWTGPYEVKEVTSHSVQVRGKSGVPWHHLTHCTPAPTPSRSLTEVRADLSSQNQNLTPK